MSVMLPQVAAEAVALRKESVDRNSADNYKSATLHLSLSARRAWIEINLVFRVRAFFNGRSPQGERG